jgi:hypothetical protein
MHYEESDAIGEAPAPNLGVTMDTPKTLKKLHNFSYQYTDFEGDRITFESFSGRNVVISSGGGVAVRIPADVLLDILDRLGVEIVPSKENTYS